MTTFWFAWFGLGKMLSLSLRRLVSSFQLVPIGVGVGDEVVLEVPAVVFPKPVSKPLHPMAQRSLSSKPRLSQRMSL